MLTKTERKNFFLCLRYPFLKSRNVFTDKFQGYCFTWLDDIPEGWRKAFGKSFCKDLKIALKKDKIYRTFRFHQIKEKYGELRIYCNGVKEHTEQVIDKYEELSRNTCIMCGKSPVKYVTEGWIYYICEDCAKTIESRPLDEDK